MREAGKLRYNIGPCVGLLMTPEQASRWNNGNLTEKDEESIYVIYPTTNRGLPDSEQILMSRCLDTTDEKYDPDVAYDLEHGNYEAELAEEKVRK